MRVVPVILMCLLAACGPRTSGKSASNDTSNNDANNTSNNATNSGSNNATNNETTGPNNATNNANNTSCPGCVLADGVCSSGDTAETCGVGGERCFACSDGWACFDGTCVEPPTCSPDNCTGCCDPVRGCVVGDTDEACGTSGLACSTCVGNEACDGQTCVAPCSETCRGCCDGEACLAGSTDAACGTEGAACEDCGDAASCSDENVCVADSCAASCAGCCDGNSCMPGTNANVCGVGGSACVDCGNGRACMNQRCVVDPGSPWEVVLVSGAVSATNQMGEPWDIIGSPDPVVDLELFDAGTMTAYRDTSSVVQDDTTPTWNESMGSNIPAAAFMVWRIDVWDSDLDFDDPICSIEVDLSSDPSTYQNLFSGATYTFSCSDPATNVFADLNFRLQ